MMRSSLAGVNIGIKVLLNSLRSGLSDVYLSRRYISSAKHIKEISFTCISESEEEVSKLGKVIDKKRKENSSAFRPNLLQSGVMQLRTEDIELGEGGGVGHIIVAAGEDLNVLYGKRGIAPSKAITPMDMLTQSLVIPKGVLGVLDIKTHVPFMINAKEPHKSFAITESSLARVPKYEEMISQYSLNVIAPLNADIAKRTAIKVQDRIFDDRNYEMFYEEVTSRVYSPTEFNKSSATLMNFERREFGVDKTTAMHYHPGERILFIYTTDKDAGVTINFCGIEENPDDRPDCKVHLRFKENSISTLVFPPYVHHKFHGEFVCISVHPREGDKLIEAVRSGSLPKGFLESATVFSGKKNDKENNGSLPEVSADDNEIPSQKIADPIVSQLIFSKEKSEKGSR
jgi:hypothetical protein